MREQFVLRISWILRVYDNYPRNILFIKTQFYNRVPRIDRRYCGSFFVLPNLRICSSLDGYQTRASFHSINSISFICQWTIFDSDKQPWYWYHSGEYRSRTTDLWWAPPPPKQILQLCRFNAPLQLNLSRIVENCFFFRKVNILSIYFNDLKCMWNRQQWNGVSQDCQPQSWKRYF